MRKPAVSVVMPVFNSRRFISAAVESILHQTLTDFEFIIVDDGSSDGTAHILREYADSDPRIVLLRQENRGVSAASNAGLALARGEFIARMDHDDISMPNRLQMQVDYLRGHPECVAVGAQVLFIDTEGGPIRVERVPLTHEEIDGALLHLGSWGMFHPTLMVKRSVLLEIGGYSLEFCNLEDLDVFLKLAERGRLANLAEVLVHYRQHMRSICFTYAEDHRRLREGIFREASRRRGRDLLPNLSGDTADHRPPAAEFEKMWAWWALESGFIATARRHAARALRMRPLRWESWLLMMCALRGR